MTAVIEARGLGKRYRRTWALSDCTLDVPAGHVVGLVGPNGAGKSTLLHLAVGLVCQHVTYLSARSFWSLQLRETVLLVAFAGLLIGFCFWRIGRDVS